MVTALDVARYILFLAKRDHEDITPLKLLKLVYFCQAWWLAYHDTSLFDEEIQAWKYGPVIKSVYDHYKHLGYKSIYIDDNMDNGKLSPEQKELVGAVWDNYKDFHAYTLRDMTHNTGTPWQSVYNGDFSTVISQDSIRQFYRENHGISV